MAVSDDLILRIRALDGATARAELEKTSRELKKVGGATQATGKKAKEAGTHFKGFGSVLGGIKWAAGVTGLAGLAFGIKDAADAATKLQEQQAQLQIALRNTGQSGAGSFERLSRSADRLATRGGFATPENLQVLAQFVRATGSAAKAQSDLSLATDVARGTHRDFLQVAKAIAMAEQGRTTGLSRLGIAIPKVTTAEDVLKNARARGQDQLLALEAAGAKFTKTQLAQYRLHHQITPEMLAQAKATDTLASKQAVLTKLQSLYGGSASKFSHTTAGAWSNARNALEQALAQIGRVALPILAKLARAAASVARSVADHWPQISRVAKAILGPIVAFGKAIFGSKTAVQALISVAAPLLAIWAAYKIVKLYQAAVTGVKTALVALGLAQQVTTGETIAFDTALMANPIGLVVAAVAALAAGLIFLALHFKSVGRVASRVFDGLKTAVSAVVGFIGAHWKLILSILTGPFGAAAIFIAGHLHQIGQVFSSVVSFIGRLAGTLWNALTWPFRKAFQFIRGIVNTIVRDFRWLVDQVKHALGFVASLPGKALHAAGSLLHSATFGLLHTGGPVQPRYFATGGPSGTDTIPGWLSPGEYVLNRQQTAQAGVRNLESWRQGGQMPGAQNITIEAAPVVLKLDGRVVAQSVLRYTLGRAARGSTSLVGGAMTTGARTAG